MSPSYYQDELTTLYQGDSLLRLRSFSDDMVDAVVTDPPYSSGGLMRSDRSQKTSDKYVLTGTALQRPGFLGDNRDQRGFLAWSSMWMAECLRLCRPGGLLLCFSDWRQVPITTDAIQAGGWVWRGIIPWDKTEAARPQKGWYRAQCEYILAATSGAMKPAAERAQTYAAGIFRGAVNPREKHHITGKPLALMSALLQTITPPATILDPFAGSGSTLLAARSLGLNSIGVELDKTYCEIARRRLSA